MKFDFRELPLLITLKRLPHFLTAQIYEQFEQVIFLVVRESLKLLCSSLENGFNIELRGRLLWLLRGSALDWGTMD